MSTIRLLPGDQVEITHSCIGLDVETGKPTLYYRSGTFGRVLRDTPHGHWVDFNHRLNAPGSYKRNRFNTVVAEWFVNSANLKLRAPQ